MLKGEMLSRDAVRRTALRQIVVNAARAAWPVLAACYALVAVVSVFQTTRHFTQYPCGYDVIHCVVVESWLASIKITTDVIGLLYAATIAIPALIFIALGGLLWWKARFTAAGLAFAYILVAMWMSDITNVSVSAMWFRFWKEFDAYLPKHAAYYFLRAMFAIAMISVIAFGLTLPTGHPVPRWTRWALVVWVLLTIPHEFMANHPVLDYNLWPKPLNALVVIGLPLISIGALAYRYVWVASEMERRQIRWVVPSSLLLGLLFIAYQIPADAMQPKILFEDTLPHFFFQTGSNVVLAIAASLLGMSVAVAILQRRLFDITLIVNRALVFGSLTAVVISLYVVVVTGVNELLGTTNPLFGSVIATALIAILFQPLYRRLQLTVNRLMYGERDDPYAVLTRMSRQLETAVAPDDALQRVVITVGHSLKLPYVSIQLDGDLRAAATFGVPTLIQLRLPLIHQNEPVGELILSPRGSETEFSRTELSLLNELARTAGIAAYAARKTLELQASRERLVTSREEERRRLQRDLHDGLGPALASVILGLDKARRLAAEHKGYDAETDTLLPLLNEIKSQTQATMQDVRDLIHELRPPILDELGLVKAIQEHIARIDGALTIHLRTPEALPELSAAVEVATYRIVQEALHNVLHHAKAAHCQINLSLKTNSPKSWIINIRDDGIGLSDTYRPGVGLASMRERAEELGGLCEVEQLVEGGTRITVCLPL